MTFDSYLTQVKGFHPAVSDFYTRYAVDALDGKTAQASAYTSISFLGAEYFPEFAYPGGNDFRRTIAYRAYRLRTTVKFVASRCVRPSDVGSGADGQCHAA